MKESSIPILIVGGGAAGTMLTLELARRGVAARTIDRLAHAAASSRAITLQARTAEMLERIDKRLIDRYLERGVHNHGYVLHLVDAQGERRVVRPAIDFTTLDSRYPYILMHRQNETEQYLREYTSAHFGRWTEWSTECIDVTQDGGEVTATLRHTDSATEEIVHCRYLVACDGASSRVHAALGRDAPDHDAGRAVVQILDAHLQGFPDADDWIHCCTGADHRVTIARLPGGFYRMLLEDRAAGATQTLTPEQGFMRAVGRHFDGVKLGEIVWHSTWQSGAPRAPHYRNGNVFLAGDSAHAHSAPEGEGINRAMQDACNLGWKLALVVHQHARAELLDSYAAERAVVAEQASSAAASLQQILRGRGEPQLGAGIVGHCSGIAATYRDRARPGPAVLAGPAVGDRAPDADLGGGRAVYDLTRHPRFTLLALRARDEGSAELTTTLRQLVGQRYDSVLEARVVPPTAAVSRHYGVDERDRFYLLRPDGYVAFRCAVGEAAALLAYLDDLFTI
jgi:2-polyprenyl-6-methoxyphenol hydroxylase-like FAD-dependent oxidoreductase